MIKNFRMRSAAFDKKRNLVNFCYRHTADMVLRINLLAKMSLIDTLLTVKFFQSGQSK